VTLAPPDPIIEVAMAAMGTVIAVQASGADADTLRARITDAMEWVRTVERICSRFEGTSELSHLVAHAAMYPGRPWPASRLLLEITGLAIAVAAASEGAFDPTVGGHLTAPGCHRHFEHGERGAAWQPSTSVPATPPVDDQAPSWRDIRVDREGGTIAMSRAVSLDLGAIAKGFAVDLVAQALADVPHLSIHAGGDVYCRGTHPEGRPWQVGIRDPFAPATLGWCAALRNAALCTSGAYERRRSDGSHHLVDPRTGASVHHLASVSVAAPATSIADAFATAAFVMGPDEGLRWLEEQGVDALLIRSEGAVLTTRPAGFATWTPNSTPS
jgi:FAD:protein FMN transferase